MTWPESSFCRLCLALATLAFAVLNMRLTETAARAAEASKTILIVDATRHMNLRFKGARRVQSLREGVRTALGRIPGEMRVGLIAYGEKPEKRCEDVADLAPIAPLEAGKAPIQNALQKLQPKAGRSPQIAAINHAAEILKAQNAAGSIILIASGADNCSEDPCAAALAFRQANPGIAIEVIGLGVSEKERPRLACLAANGGGFTAAVNTADVAKALTEAANRANAASPSAAAESAPATASPQAAQPPKGAQTPPLPERKSGLEEALSRLELPLQPPNVTLRAVLAPGGHPIQQGVSWRIYPAAAGSEKTTSRERKPAPPVWVGSGAEPKIRLAAGHYHVQAEYGFATAEAEIAVAEDTPLDMTMPLNAGAIEVSAVARPGGEVLDQMFFTLFAPEEKDGGRWREVGRSSRSRAVFHVSAGKYRIVGQHGQAEAETFVTLAPGQVQSAQIAMNAGKLKLEARTGPDAPALQQVFYYVYAVDGGGDKEIARSAAPEPVFYLSSGQYRIVAQYDLAKAERLITLAPGQDLRERFVLEGGSLKLAAKLAGKDAPLTRDVRYTLYKLRDGGIEAAQDVSRFAGLDREFYLSSGRYRIESKYGFQNALETVDITIAPGDRRELLFEHRCSSIKLAAVDKPGGKPLPRARWTVKNEAGAVIANTTLAAPELILAAGKYEAGLNYGQKSYTLPFEVGVNEAKIVEVQVK